MTPSHSTPSLSIGDLENVYDLLAKAIDQAGPQQDKVFLVKLALLCAQERGDAALFSRLVDQALRDLP